MINSFSLIGLKGPGSQDSAHAAVSHSRAGHHWSGGSRNRPENPSHHPSSEKNVHCSTREKMQVKMVNEHLDTFNPAKITNIRLIYSFVDGNYRLQSSVGRDHPLVTGCSNELPLVLCWTLKSSSFFQSKIMKLCVIVVVFFFKKKQSHGAA